MTAGVLRTLRWDFVADPPTRLMAELDLARMRLRRGDWREARRAATRLLRHLDARPATDLSGMSPIQRAEIRADGLGVQAITSALMNRRDWEDVLAESLSAYEALQKPNDGLRPSGLAGYGMVLALTGRDRDAVEPLVRAAEAGEDLSTKIVLSLAQRLNTSGDRGASIRLLRAVHERYPNEAGLASDLAEFYRLADRTHEAAAADIDAGSLLAEDGHFEAALEHFDRAVRSVPDHPLATLGRCQVLVAMGRAADALAEIDEIGWAYPELAGIHVVAALALSALGRTREALSRTEFALEEFPDDPWALDARVHVLLARGRYDEAIAALDAALAIDPTDRLWRGLRAEVRVVVGQDVDVSIQVLRELAAVSPGPAESSARLARALRATGRSQEALDIVLKSLDEQPASAPLAVLQIELLTELGDPRGAIEVAEKAIEGGLSRWLVAIPIARALLEAGDIGRGAAIAEAEVEARPSEQARAVLGVARHHAGRHEEAVAQLEPLIADLGSDPVVLSALTGSLVAIGAESLRRTADLEQAVAFFRRAAELDQSCVQAHQLLAEAYRRKGEYIEALEHANKGIELAPDNSWLIGTRGQILESLEGKEDEAESDLRNAIELDPSLNWARAELGELLRVRNRHEEAIVVLKDAVRHSPKDPWTLASLGAAEYAVDNYDEALETLSRALMLDGDYAWAHAAIGAVFADIDRPDDARSHIERAVELDGTLGWAWLQRGWLDLLDTFHPDGALRDSMAAGRAMEAFQAAVGPAPEGERQLLLAEACIIDGRHDEALDLFRKLSDDIKVRRVPDPPGLRRLGWCELRLGHHDASIDAFVSAISLEATDVASQFDLALAVLCAGRIDLAMEEYARGIEQLGRIKHRGRRRALVRVALHDLSSLSVDQLMDRGDLVRDVRALLNQQGGQRWDRRFRLDSGVASTTSI